MDGVTTLPIGVAHGLEEDPHLLLQASKPLKGTQLELFGHVIADNYM